MELFYDFRELNEVIRTNITSINITLPRVISEDLKLDLSGITGLLMDWDLSSLDIRVDQLINALLDNLILANIPSVLTFDYNVVEGYDSTDGKFSNAIGSTAMIDCHYVIDSLLPGLFD
mmetsp:Transcript_1248/g.779  ORF Transcript_1248/g.779 Transcript_1248/m.779 type:complete len:119 (+) Transcript_1248:208-564(+)